MALKRKPSPAEQKIRSALPPRIRNRRYHNLHDFAQVEAGKYTVRRGGNTYRVEGGRKLGGTAHEWFLSGPGFDHDVPCSSLADALRLLDGM